MLEPANDNQYFLFTLDFYSYGRGEGISGGLGSYPVFSVGTLWKVKPKQT